MAHVCNTDWPYRLDNPCTFLWVTRKEHKMTQKDAAARLGISVKELGRLEKHEAVPSPELTLKIVKIFYGEHKEALWAVERLLRGAARMSVWEKSKRGAQEAAEKKYLEVLK